MLCVMMCSGAGGLGIFLTLILQTTAEDLLAVLLAGLAGYVAILNLPLRRADAKRKLENVATKFVEVCTASS